MIIAEQLSVKVGERLILKDVSIQIPAGKVTAIMGPNGAGKSSLLRCLTGANQINRGKVTINGKPLNSYSLEALSRMRAVLSQSNSIDFPFSAFDIVKMGRNPHGACSSSTKDDDIALRALECVNCLAMKDRNVQTLSGGERQRIHLARVLAQLWESKNSFLFLDEPTSALDLKHQHQILMLIRDLVADRGIGVCIVLHDLNLAMRYTDQMLLMRDGELYAFGETYQVLSSKNIENVFEVSMSSIFYERHTFA
ncbi:MAG: heme ABC transporter ATP-binding protein [Methylotenera sp.]